MQSGSRARRYGSRLPPFVDGSDASLFAWEGWTVGLQRDHRVIAVDLPAHGLTGPDPRGRYSPVAMAGFVEHFVGALGVPLFSLAGNSMGGGVAWRYALLHPEQAERLILVDSAGYPRDEPKPLAFCLAAMPILGRVVRWVTPRRLVARSLRNTHGDPSCVSDALVDRYEDLLLL